MPRKKLNNFQVLYVEEMPKHAPDMRTCLQPVSLDVLRHSKHAPDGTFIRWMDTLILPKRKKGIKFLATYTEIFQKEL